MIIPTPYYEFDPLQTKPTRYLANYDSDIFERYLKENYNIIERNVLKEFEKENLNGAINNFEERLKRAYQVSEKKGRNIKQLQENGKSK